MASLIARAARTRAQSRSLRAEIQRLRVVSRWRAQATHEQLQEVHELYAVLEARRARGIPSPWSELRWCAPDAELDRVLEVVPA